MPLPSPQGTIVQVVEDFALDEQRRVWRRGWKQASVYVPDDSPIRSRPRALLPWPCVVAEDGAIQCVEHPYAGLNPTARPAWAGSDWDRDGDPIAFKVHHELRQWGYGEYVAARGAEQVMWGCFRRGSRVFRSGPDFGCPRTNPTVVRTRTRPELPEELPGKPDEVGICWDPVEQPIAAAQLFPGCLALDRDGVLFDLFVKRPPRELARGVRLATPIEGKRVVVVHQDGRVVTQETEVDRNLTPSAEPIRALAPPQPVDSPPIRHLFREGVIHEDGTAAMFWSAGQLLRPLTGFSGAVELAATSREICVRTEAKEVFCAYDVPYFKERAVEPAALVLTPAVFHVPPPERAIPGGSSGAAGP